MCPWVQREEFTSLPVQLPLMLLLNLFLSESSVAGRSLPAAHCIPSPHQQKWMLRGPHHHSTPLGVF